jgi:hypothetical protein
MQKMRALWAGNLWRPRAFFLMILQILDDPVLQMDSFF